MSGHSKWAGIKHKKALVDAKRGTSFTRLGNNVTVAAKQGGGDPTLNAGLRMAIDKARAANMPKDNVDRAIRRGTGELGGAAVEELLFEGFGPGNTAVLVEALTDNRNRTNADVRMLFNKNGGRIADGGVAYQFTQRGVIRFDLPGSTVIEEAAIIAGADDYLSGDGYVVVYTEPSDLHAVKDGLASAGFAAESVRIEWVPNSPIEQDEDTLEKIASLIEALEENDDVTAVHTNLSE